MKNNLVLLILLVFSAVFAQKKKREEFYSSILGETRNITIITPPYYKDTGEKKYPLVIVLDGEYLLEPFNGIFAYTAYWDELPEVILVGINQNKDNMRESVTEYEEQTGLPYGKGAQFFEFITQELVPYIEEGYSVGPMKVIAGHNITAGFINAFLLKEKPFFNGYINLSPDFQPNMEDFVPAALQSLKTPIYYYVAVADGDAEDIRNKAKIFNTNMAAASNPEVKYRFDEFKSTTHYALAACAIPAAIYHVFSFYQPISSQEFEKIASLPSGQAKYLKDKYEAMKKILGYDVTIRLNDFKAVEVAILKKGNFEELKELSSLAKKNYPKTIFGEYYTGLFYEKTGDKKKALKTYANSYSLNSIAEYTKDFMIQKAESVQSTEGN
ncbi:alpha/beta hydrolase [Flavobacterium cyanobacteriorum]|nr:alpha/beta hydrolase-fold protein [Flavobacterium cyanobacteriorum]